MNRTRSHGNAVSDELKSQASKSLSTGGRATYEDDAIYQEGKIVARVVAPEVRSDSREIRFAEINGSDDLMLPEECEFQEYRLMVQRIEYASRVDKNAPEKGRVLRGVVAEILGYREH